MGSAELHYWSSVHLLTNFKLIHHLIQSTGYRTKTTNKDMHERATPEFLRHDFAGMINNSTTTVKIVCSNLYFNFDFYFKFG